MDSQVFKARRDALRAAVAYAGSSELTPDQVLRTAGTFLKWLVAPAVSLRVRVSPVTFSLTSPGAYRPTTSVQLEGGGMAVEMQDNEYVTLSAAPALDAEGNPASDSGYTWSADQPTLATLVPSADGTECNVGAAGPLGLVNVFLTDAAGNVSPADPITIIAGPATQIGITSGTPAVIPSGGIPVPAGLTPPASS